MRFYLGTHKPGWLGRLGVPLFVSARRLRERKSLPRASAPWALDSGGFTELSMHGRWLTPARQYAEEAERWSDLVGSLAWAAPQDWMCEPHVLEKTGGTVRLHQHRTVMSYITLREMAPSVNWIPVLQGWTHDDYLDHAGMWGRALGHPLSDCPLVGVGSVCRRQATATAEDLVRELKGLGMRLHLFGFKLDGLARVAGWLGEGDSSDSMAWSLDARRSAPLPGCPHRSCANCPRYALAWRGRLLDRVKRNEGTRQGVLFGEGS